MKRYHTLILIGILVLGLTLRLWNSNWDSGYHLHPDERAIILFTLPLQLPLSFAQFFSPLSSWNPHFFAYGSFPLYLLKIVASFLNLFNSNFSTYDGIVIIGRTISAIFDTATIFIIYILSAKLFSKKIALLAAFFYTMSVLPIQLSHFYAVDTILTFFILLLLYKLIRFYEQPTKRKALGIGILFGFALATKTSAFLLLFSIGLTISLDFLLVFLRQPQKHTVWSPHIPLFIKRLIIEGSIILLATVGTFFILEPYAFIDFNEFWTQTLQQSAMTKSAFTFPYTLQYVGKIPYIYELKNILLWGMGPTLGISALLGLFLLHIYLYKYTVYPRQKLMIILSFFWIYFFVVGSFAIGFMRYVLPLYPLLCLFAAFLIMSCVNALYKKFKPAAAVFIILFLFLTMIWPFSFLQIYQKEPTRVTATEWILKNIPEGKTLAIEHWDDSLPLRGQQQYTMLTLELYNPDTQQKWQIINDQLTQTDYIILASNRLYTPLSKLTDCKALPSYYCYTKTADYYQNLFSGNLDFTKIAEFSVYPQIPFLHIPLDDSRADESFTVYDHPKIIIFQRNK